MDDVSMSGTEIPFYCNTDIHSDTIVVDESSGIASFVGDNPTAKSCNDDKNFSAENSDKSYTTSTLCSSSSNSKLSIEAIVKCNSCITKVSKVKGRIMYRCEHSKLRKLSLADLASVWLFPSMGPHVSL